MILKRLDDLEKQKTRQLWEEIFSEDSSKFLDYYYEEKTRENEIFAIVEEKQTCAMLHLNPYRLMLGDRCVSADYIVAVATKKELRHKGYMSAMLREAFECMYEEQKPLTFLMPAKEEIYLPFGFRVVYRQKRAVYKRKAYENKEHLKFVKAKEQDAERLAELANRIIRQDYMVYTKRDEAYYKALIKEQQSQNGFVMLICREDKLIGSFLYGIEENIEIREPLFFGSLKEEFMAALEEYFMPCQKQINFYAFETENAETVPCIMFRLVNLQSLLGLLSAKENIQFTFEFEDSIITKNSGIYEVFLGKDGGRAGRTKSLKPEMKLEPAVLTELLFGDMGLDELILREMPEIQEETRSKLHKINRFGKIFLNEIV